MHFKYVIFDMDGLIFDTEQLFYEIIRDRLSASGYTITRDIFAALVGVPFDESISFYAKHYPGYTYNFEDDEIEYKKRIYEGHLRIKPGLLELIDRLEQLGVRKCIASSNMRWAIDLCLEYAGLENRFEFIFCDGMVELCKPAPDLFLAAAQKFGAKPSECLVLEDSIPGINAALAAGCPVIAVPDIVTVSDDLAKRCFGVYESLLDVEQLFAETNL